MLPCKCTFATNTLVIHFANAAECETLSGRSQDNADTEFLVKISTNTSSSKLPPTANSFLCLLKCARFAIQQK